MLPALAPREHGSRGPKGSGWNIASGLAATTRWGSKRTPSPTPTTSTSVSDLLNLIVCVYMLVYVYLYVCCSIVEPSWLPRVWFCRCQRRHLSINNPIIRPCRRRGPGPRSCNGDHAVRRGAQGCIQSLPSATKSLPHAGRLRRGGCTSCSLGQCWLLSHCLCACSIVHGR